MAKYIATVHIHGEEPFESEVEADSYKDAGNYAWGTWPDADDIEIEETDL